MTHHLLSFWSLLGITVGDLVFLMVLVGFVVFLTSISLDSRDFLEKVDKWVWFIIGLFIVLGWYALSRFV